MSTTELRVEIVCDTCFNEFTVTPRYLRLVRRGAYPQPTTCRSCSPTNTRGRGPRLGGTASRKVTDSERRWALNHFTDEQIAEIAAHCWGVPYHPEVVAAKRVELSLAASAQRVA